MMSQQRARNRVTDSQPTRHGRGRYTGYTGSHGLGDGGYRAAWTGADYESLESRLAREEREEQARTARKALRKACAAGATLVQDCPSCGADHPFLKKKRWSNEDPECVEAGFEHREEQCPQQPPCREEQFKVFEGFFTEQGVVAAAEVAPIALRDANLGAARRVENCWLYAVRGDVRRDRYAVAVVWEGVVVTRGETASADLAQTRWHVPSGARREVLPGDHLIVQDCEPAMTDALLKEEYEEFRASNFAKEMLLLDPKFQAGLAVRVQLSPALPAEPVITEVETKPHALRLHWEPPENDGGAPVLSYRVVVRCENAELEALHPEPSQVSDDRVRFPPMPPLVFEVDEVPPGECTVRPQALNQANVGARSSRSSAAEIVDVPHRGCGTGKFLFTKCCYRTDLTGDLADWTSSRDPHQGPQCVAATGRKCTDQLAGLDTAGAGYAWSKGDYYGCGY